MPKAQDSKNWVNFKEIKSQITMEIVLSHYGLFESMKKSGANYVSCCPIHRGSNSRQFSVNLEKNIWHCFGNCKSGGNVLDFVAKKEDVSIREAALLLKDWFPDALTSSQKPPKTISKSKTIKDTNQRKRLVRKVKKGQSKKPKKQIEPTKSNQPINPPLTFELKTLILDHPFFNEQEILQKTIKHFGLGFCSRGMMKDRIAIPIHNEQGELVAYCGRTINQEQIEAEGKYKLPPNFVKSAVVYNLHRQRESENLLILVESFLSVFRLYQAGFENVAALKAQLEHSCVFTQYKFPLNKIAPE